MAVMGKISTLFGKNKDYFAEYHRFKKAMVRNSHDDGLKAQFINFCLINRFTKHETVQNHITEALDLYETINHKEHFNLQCMYLVGKYYQEEKDIRAAYRIYLDAIKHFNRHVGRSPNLKAENADLAYSITLNLMTLQSNPEDEDVKLCFTILRKSYPLHLKRIELDNEMARPMPNMVKVKQLNEEIQKLKESEEKALAPTPAERSPLPTPVRREREPEAATAKPIEVKATPARPAVESAPVEVKSVASKPSQTDKSAPANVRVDNPNAVVKTAAKEPIEKKKKESHANVLSPGDGENLDFLKFSPTFETSSHDVFFMVYKENSWEGPYTPSQLSSKGFLKPDTWVCRSGSEHVTLASDIPDLALLFK